MRLGRVIGKLWATQKDPQLDGVKLYVMQPLDEELNADGAPIIVADTIGAGEGDVVFWVRAREATFAVPGRKIPSDATIVGIVDSATAASREELEKVKARLRQANFIERNGWK